MFFSVTSFFFSATTTFAQTPSDTMWMDAGMTDPVLILACSDSSDGCSKPESKTTFINLPQYPFCQIAVTYTYRNCPEGKQIDVKSMKLAYHFQGGTQPEACDNFRRDMDSMLKRALNPLPGVADTVPREFFRQIRDSAFLQIAKADFTQAVVNGTNNDRALYSCSGTNRKRTYTNIQGACMKVVHVPQGATIDSNYTPMMDTNGFVYSSGLTGLIGVAGGIGAFPWSTGGGVIPVTTGPDTSSVGKQILYYNCGPTCCNVVHEMCYDSTEPGKMKVVNRYVVNRDKNIATAQGSCPKTAGVTQPRKHYKGELEFPCGRFCKETTTFEPKTSTGGAISSSGCNCHKAKEVKATEPKEQVIETVGNSKTKSGAYNR